MKYIWFALFILVVGVGFYFVSPEIPPVVTMKNLTPTYSFNDTFKLDVTITNYTAQPKSINLASDNLVDNVTSFVDYGKTPSVTPIGQDQIYRTETIPPFGHETVKLSYSMQQVSIGNRQTFTGTGGVLSLTPGSHTYVVSWAGFTSDQLTFYVE